MANTFYEARLSRTYAKESNHRDDIALTSFACGKGNTCLQITIGEVWTTLTESEATAFHAALAAWLRGDLP